jgi:U6 snRNA-associated Sm-like protein LSm4
MNSNIHARPQVKYLRVPDEIVDIVKEQQATAQAQRGGGHRGGRGGDRGDRGGRGGRGGMGGRGRGRGGRGQAA